MSSIDLRSLDIYKVIQYNKRFEAVTKLLEYVNSDLYDLLNKPSLRIFIMLDKSKPYLRVVHGFHNYFDIEYDLTDKNQTFKVVNSGGYSLTHKRYSREELNEAFVTIIKNWIYYHPNINFTKDGSKLVRFLHRLIVPVVHRVTLYKEDFKDIESLINDYKIELNRRFYG